MDIKTVIRICFQEIEEVKGKLTNGIELWIYWWKLRSSPYLLLSSCNRWDVVPFISFLTLVQLDGKIHNQSLYSVTSEGMKDCLQFRLQINSPPAAFDSSFNLLKVSEKEGAPSLPFPLDWLITSTFLFLVNVSSTCGPLKQVEGRGERGGRSVSGMRFKWQAISVAFVPFYSRWFSCNWCHLEGFNWEDGEVDVNVRRKKAASSKSPWLLALLVTRVDPSRLFSSKPSTLSLLVHKSWILNLLFNLPNH